LLFHHHHPIHTSEMTMTSEQEEARDDACGMAGEIGKLDNEARGP
jgi:hypothetical protein